MTCLYSLISEITITGSATVLLILFAAALGFQTSATLTKLAKAELITKTVKIAFFWSLIPLFLNLTSEFVPVDFGFYWFAIGSLPVWLTLNMDSYSVVFLPVALYVTWSILDFAQWYMKEDPNIDQFFKFLLIFLISMIILVTSNNLFMLFIGWEGVGIMSFLLISWWFARPDANTAALQAVMYNRAADLGLIAFMAWTMFTTGSWEFNEIFMYLYDHPATAPGLMLIVAAAGKSAQFGLHPWLPSAMEGPTPVSALLHSSTMVVAGIFLLIRLHPVIAATPTAMTVCLCLGALTTLFTAACALTQNDIKKIIAFSTSSQLGLMMVTVGLGHPNLAFLHICTHAFFKAMLFICSGSIIHSLDNEQDIRKMGGMFHLIPLTSSCITLGSLALVGTPFLSGFYSKDAIIEALNTSNLNAWALALTLLATSFTAVYSLRIAYYVLTGKPRFIPLPPVDESDDHLKKALIRLAMGSLFFGYLIINTLPPMLTPVLTMPTSAKMAAIVVTLLGLGLGFLVSWANSSQARAYPRLRSHFTTLLGFFPSIVHRYIPKSALTLGQLISHQLVDQIWLKLAGPDALSKSNASTSKYINSIQRGVIKLHLMTFIASMAMMLLIFYFIT
uniref:NADH-ubiquinone oxidoreductase chain 5 n=1 Tax=Cynoglossus itinus TaxID=626211 RepID=W5QKH6_9PLEU|nr:NADH dehydrogenase subunit 5 [Cynoglossus itinus]AFC88400.1 NADH dehydrogenase subunit 5 [Cynoglossus itinus]